MNEDKDPSYRELIMKQILGSSLSLLGGPVKVKEFLGGLSSWAGTSKDEIVGKQAARDIEAGDCFRATDIK